MSESLTLFHYWRSSASWRVRWGLAIKKIAYESVAVDLLSRQEKEKSYLERNPSGYVPCLMVGKEALGESLAILEWLEENYPKPSFYSGNSILRARIRQLAETINAGLQPLQNLDVIRRISDDKEKQSEWIRYWNCRGLGLFETLLSRLPRNGCAFAVSNEPSLADICLIPQCYSALRFNVDLSQFPQCKSIYEHALTTRECQESGPEAWRPST